MDYPSSGHDDLMPQAEPTVAELLHASSPSDLDEASQDAQVAAARELESRHWAKKPARAAWTLS